MNIIEAKNIKPNERIWTLRNKWEVVSFGIDEYRKDFITTYDAESKGLDKYRNIPIEHLRRTERYDLIEDRWSYENV